MENIELTLLTVGQIFGDENEKQLEVFKKYGTKMAVTDLCILTGCSYERDTIDEDRSLTGRTAWYWTKPYDNDVYVVNFDGGLEFDGDSGTDSDITIRPVLQSSQIFSRIFSNRIHGHNGTEEVELGDYLQYVASESIQEKLVEEFKKGMNKTGRTYTFDATFHDDDDHSFNPVIYEEYEYQGKKYVRVEANITDYTSFPFSDKQLYDYGYYVWVEVSPVVWLIDEETQTLISKRGLVSMSFNDKKYDGNFEKTKMYEFLNKYMIKDIFQSVDLEKMIAPAIEKNAKRKENPYNFISKKVSEEEIIKGAIESNVPVFLHGPSSEGKSARVRQIDEDCVIIYLRNATPDSLNGKSVYNSETNEMIDIKPTWLKKLESKCEAEPDKLHILFFDEITNALPSIQGSAFNIVLDREVNGIWKLPENVRIVAAGNEMSDSLAANKLAEPLFNRFAHVYINTTCESWLKWASENNIHPAIYSYIAYKKGEVLRSKYDGEKPNADPRKWEMASKMLYSTNNPEMLRALVGEDITKEFVRFCNQPVITLKDVINGNYTKEEIEYLNTSERYATVMNLSQVDEENVIIVRDFVKNLGAEFISLFDCMWAHNDEKRLEIIAEAKLEENSKSK